MQNQVFQSKLKSTRAESKILKSRQPLVTIKQNNRSSQTFKSDLSMKRTSQIIQMPIKINMKNRKTQQIITYFNKLPLKDRHLMTAQLKCFMMAKHVHDSHLIDQRLVAHAIQKIRNNYKTKQRYDFNFDKFIQFSDTVIKKCGDTLVLSNHFEECMSQKYPPTIQMMFIYLGVFLYSVNSQYENAQNYCQKLFDMIIKYKVEEYFIIYLLLKIKLKTNLSEWQDALKFLTKLVFFSWMYNLPDLQIWCYFELSRVYFFLQNHKQSQVFRIKSENNSIQPKRSIYRQVQISNLIIQIQAIWEGQLQFKYNSVIDKSRLVVPEYHRYGVQQYISDQRKLKANIKNIVQDCKIRHVNNLLNRIGQISLNHIQKTNSQNLDSLLTSNYDCFKGLSKYNSRSSLNSSINSSQIPSSPKSGNNFLLTHKSHNKNMCMFFRRRVNQQNSNKKVFYTIQNSQKSWAILKQMLKNILTEMTYFSSKINV